MTESEPFTPFIKMLVPIRDGADAPAPTEIFIAVTPEIETLVPLNNPPAPPPPPCLDPPLPPPATTRKSSDDTFAGVFQTRLPALNAT
jgi:hypothetical protein